MADIDLTQPLVPIQLAADASGIAVVARCQERAIGFFMIPRQGPGEFRIEELATEIAHRLGWKIIQERLRAELRIATVLPLSKPSVTVAICTKIDLKALERCLRSIMKATSSANGTGVEILVVDNAPSTDATKRIVAGHTDIRYVLEPKPGLDFARNAALREARGDLVASIACS
jgi:hypothetical protein